MLTWQETIHRFRCGITLSLLVVLALIGATRPAQADARPPVRSEAVAPIQPTAPGRARTVSGSQTYRVVSGDTLIGIARRLTVPGGWRALYAVNRSIIGTDPNRVLPGWTLTIPAVRSTARGRTGTRSVRYVAAAGDTLSGIARRLDVTGGWPALYALNRSEIGTDPNRLRPGTRLTIPATPSAGHVTSHSATTSTSPATVSPRPAAPGRSGTTAARTPSVVATAAASAPSIRGGSAGIPRWLQAMLLLVGVMVVLFLFGEPAVVALGRGRPAAARRLRAWTVRRRRSESPLWMAGSGPVYATQAPPRPDLGGPPSPTVVLADHERLVVTSVPGRGVIVLRPPGQAIEEILRVARVVLAEPEYRVLAQQLAAGNASNTPQRAVANGLRSKLRPEPRRAFGAVDGPVL